MNCPQCGTTNTDNEAKCINCGAALAVSATAPPASRRLSRKAVTSLILALLGILWLALAWHLRVGLMDLVGLFGLSPIVLFFLFWLSPVLTGSSALQTINDSHGGLKGNFLAWAAIILGICTLITAAFLSYVAANLTAPVRSVLAKVSRARTDMRSLSVAIEAYYMDSNIYPPWGIGSTGPGGTWTYNYAICTMPGPGGLPPQRLYYYGAKKIGPFVGSGLIESDFNHPKDLPTFLTSGPGPTQRFATLTTPQAFITSYPSDPFCPVRGSTFVYWSIYPGQPDPSGKIAGKDSPLGGVGWILVCPGPDLKYDLPGEWDVYDPKVAQPSPRLLAGTNKRGFAFTYDPTNGMISDGDIWRVKQ